MVPLKDILNYGMRDFTINTSIYALVVVPFFLIFWVFFKKYFQARRIQTVENRPPNITRHELKYSLLTLLIFSCVDMSLYVAFKSGYTQLYRQVDAYGWAYFGFSIILMILLHDAWFYWTHRLMHHPKIFKYVHKVHHQSTDPSPFAAFSFHPLEALIEAGIYILFAFLLPIHIWALLSWQLIQMILNVIGHLGYELYPKGFNKHWLFRWKTPSTHHNLHHSHFNGNYGLYFTWWDKRFNTEFKEYEQTYDAIQARIHSEKNPL
jgi:sterol desaturase/sphingolipid hydroxylase (fatty acid hydroxylase superfamily)